jgi:TRAP-type C4-dicarboxylate transport system permease small subunit
VAGSADWRVKVPGQARRGSAAQAPETSSQPPPSSDPGGRRLAVGSLLQWSLEAVLCAILVSMAMVLFGQVVFRYLLHMPLSWSEEVARFLLMWAGMLGAAYAFKTRAHFALGYLAQRVRPRWRKLFVIVNTLAMSGFLAVFVWSSLELVVDASTNIAPGSQLPMAVPYAAAPVGGLLILYYVLRNGWEEVRRAARSYFPS